MNNKIKLLLIIIPICIILCIGIIIGINKNKKTPNNEVENTPTTTDIVQNNTPIPTVEPFATDGIDTPVPTSTAEATPYILPIAQVSVEAYNNLSDEEKLQYKYVWDDDVSYTECEEIYNRLKAQVYYITRGREGKIEEQANGFIYSLQGYTSGELVRVYDNGIIFKLGHKTEYAFMYENDYDRTLWVRANAVIETTDTITLSEIYNKLSDISNVSVVFAMRDYTITNELMANAKVNLRTAIKNEDALNYFTCLKTFDFSNGRAIASVISWGDLSKTHYFFSEDGGKTWVTVSDIDESLLAELMKKCKSIVSERPHTFTENQTPEPSTMPKYYTP